jgi:hypothetical protein
MAIELNDGSRIAAPVIRQQRSASRCCSNRSMASSS